MARMIGQMIGWAINLVWIVIALPFAILGAILSGLSRARNSERNQQNGADIRALCTELGVPSDAYNRIVISEISRAKDIAMYIGRPGMPHHSSPWNTRLAIAIAQLHHSSPNSQNDLQWMKVLWNWADAHGIEEHNIPRDRSDLLKLRHLSFESISYFEKEKFSFLPKEICNLNKLQFLELGSVSHPEILLNDLVSLPMEIGNLTELTHLYLQFNSLTKLPDEIGNLNKLKVLKLGGNRLATLPKQIGNLKNLEILTAWRNNLSEIPKEIGQLTSLRGLDISSNSLTELPKEITNLTKLEKFIYRNDELRLSEHQKEWIKLLKSKGCKLYPEEVMDDFTSEDIPF